MDCKILLGKILQRAFDKVEFQADDLSQFRYIKETRSSIFVMRKKGTTARISFDQILKGIEAYQMYPHLYSCGPSELRKFGITHVNSPVYALLHLLVRSDYKN